MNACDSPLNFDQRSIWELNNRMPTISELGMSSIHGSQLYPQYLSDTRQLQPYRQAWIPDETKSPNNKTTQGFMPNKRCILVTLGIGLLIGIVICGVPLAVMTTLYLQEKSQSQTAITSSTASSLTNETNTQVALPSQCISYTTNTDSTRNVAYTGCCYCESISGGWYRFLGAAGTRLSTFPSNTGTCGYNYPSWLNASLPTTRGAVTSGNICFNNGGNICTTYSSANIALVTNCGDYYVFFLPALSVCGYRYCTT